MIACWVCVVNCISAKVLPSTGFLLIIAYCAVERQQSVTIGKEYVPSHRLHFVERFCYYAGKITYRKAGFFYG